MGLFAENYLIALLYILIGLSTLAYAYGSYLFTYWQRKGFKTLPVEFPFGHFKPTFLQQRNFGDHLQDVYKSTSEKFIGIYASFRPILLLCDPEVIKAVLVKDFNNFTDRNVHFDEKNDPLSAHLFSMRGQKWKNMRAKLTPAFTSGKLKAMFPTLIECSRSLQNYLRKASEQEATIEMYELAACHGTNVIASVAFGLEVDCIKDSASDFRKYGRKVFETSFKNGVRGALNFLCPSLIKYIKLRLFDKDVEEFVLSVIAQNLKLRENNNVVRKDFFQLLVQLRNTGTVELNDEWKTVIKNTNEDQKAFTFHEVAAQAFIFFAAGFETSSTTLAYCLYELAKNPRAQKRAHDEIDEVLQRHNGQLTYESVSEMKYLEWCVDETLRKYPVLPVLNRTCLRDYKIANTNHVIPKGVEVFIPVLALQRDERYYPEPEKFIPERFDDENSNDKDFINRPYMPFGEGPRNCIGLRLGKMQAKVSLVAMLKEFKYSLDERHSNKEIAFDPCAFLILPRGGLHFYVSKR